MRARRTDVRFIRLALVEVDSPQDLIRSSEAVLKSFQGVEAVPVPR
jgi:hypothetical protein